MKVSGSGSASASASSARPEQGGVRAGEREARLRHYAERRATFEGQARALHVRAERARNFGGLLLVLALGMGAAAVWGPAPLPALLLGIPVLLGLVLLLSQAARLQREEDDAERSREINARGEKRCRGTWHELPEDGQDFLDAEHRHAGDLDLFGPSSLFQRINTAHTRHGQHALAAWLTEPATLAESRARQQAVRCLVPALELRQRLEALTLPPAAPPRAPRSLLRRTTAEPSSPASDVERLLRWAEAPAELSRRRALVAAARLLPAGSVLALLASQLWGVPSLIWKVGVLLQAFLIYRTHRQVGLAFGVVGRWQGTFGRLAQAFELLDGLQLESPLIEGLRQTTRRGPRRAADALEQLDHVLGWFALRNSEWGHPPLNLFFCWDIHCLVALERWQRVSGRELRGWLEALGQLEAACSLAGLAHDDPELSFPELEEGPTRLEAEGLAHPLLSPERRVSNDVCLPGPGRCLLVTGSNMSGKSTLLRAIGLAAVLALAGGPVCARRLKLAPLRVYTSLRVNDSLADGVSRFYAELTRLRGMLAATRETGSVLFLIDEILAGTNSVERGVGARWVLGELLVAGALGAVSTHDAALCQLPAGLMDRVEQVHFREAVAGEQLVFDYRLRPGPVKAGNALRLMRALGLSVP